MKRIGIAVGTALVLAAGAVLWVRARAARDDQRAGLEFATVERGTVRKTVTADGELRALTSVFVKSDAGGRIEVLAVDVGDKVKKGDLIAKIDPTESQTSYDQAVADLTAARANLTRAREQSYAQVELTRTSIAQAQASYDAAVKDLERLENATHPQARAQARAALDTATASLESAQKEQERLEQATHPAGRAQARAALDKATASLESAQKDLQRLNESSQPTARVDASAALDKAKSDLGVAEKELQRANGLRAEGLIPQSELESVESRYDSARADFAMAQERANRIAADQAAELRSAETRVEQAKAELASAQKAWDTLDAGQSAELKSAQARVAQAQAELASAQERWRTIAQDQAAERESARAKVAQAKAALEHARADAVQRQVRQAEVASANAQVDRVQAQVKSAQTTLGYTTVRAPRDGVILQRYVEEGTIVTSGSRGVMEGMNIVELGDLTKMFVDVDVDESDLADVRLGQSVEIQVDACGGDVFRGTVTRIDPQAVTTQNVTTVPVEVEVQGHDARLMPGLTATCDFVVAEAEDTLHLPSRVVRSSGDGYVVTVSQAGRLVQVAVEVGVQGDERTEILEGLKEGDQVVVPQLGGPGSGEPDRGEEMGRRMGGAGGFLR